MVAKMAVKGLIHAQLVISFPKWQVGVKSFPVNPASYLLWKRKSMTLIIKRCMSVEESVSLMTFLITDIIMIAYLDTKNYEEDHCPV